MTSKFICETCPNYRTENCNPDNVDTCIRLEDEYLEDFYLTQNTLAELQAEQDENKIWEE